METWIALMFVFALDGSVRQFEGSGTFPDKATCAVEGNIKMAEFVKANPTVAWAILKCVPVEVPGEDA